MGEVRELSKTSPTIPTYAVEHMKKLELKFRDKSVSNMSRQEMISVYRELKYISQLKTSTVEGAIKSADVFSPIADKLQSFSPELKRKFWEVFGKSYEENRLLDRFKYEIFEHIIDEVNSATDTDELTAKVLQAYQETVEEEGKNVDDDKFRLSFTGTLSELLSQFD